MLNRILRAELLESEGWLGLKDNADRAAFIACLLTVDNFGDMPAGPHRLVKLWRPYGIDTEQKAAKAFSDLADMDLVRRYVVDGKPYLHIPRFRQKMRWLGHVWPLSEWATNEEKQRVGKKPHADHGGPQADVDVDLDKSITGDRSPSKAPQPVDKSVPPPRPGESMVAYQARLLAARKGP